jgi:hypothetical protein
VLRSGFNLVVQRRHARARVQRRECAHQHHQDGTNRWSCRARVSSEQLGRPWFLSVQPHAGLRTTTRRLDSKHSNPRSLHGNPTRAGFNLGSHRRTAGTAWSGSPGGLDDGHISTCFWLGEAIGSSSGPYRCRRSMPRGVRALPPRWFSSFELQCGTARRASERRFVPLRAFEKDSGFCVERCAA